MPKKFHSVLLVDDDEITNFINRKVIELADLSDEIHEVYNGKQAIDFLLEIEAKKSTDVNIQSPDLIILDINMPEMNGWEFLEEYRKLRLAQNNQYILMMLTTSLQANDRLKRESFDEIAGFCNKPLTVEMLLTYLEA